MKQNPDEELRKASRHIDQDRSDFQRMKILQLRAGLNPVDTYYRSHLEPLEVPEAVFKEMLQILVSDSSKDWSWIAIPHSDLDLIRWREKKARLDSAVSGADPSIDVGIALWINSFYIPVEHELPIYPKKTIYTLAVRPSRRYGETEIKENWITVSTAIDNQPFLAGSHYASHPSIFWFQELLDEYHVRRKYHYQRSESLQYIPDVLAFGYGLNENYDPTGTTEELKARMFRWARRLNPKPSEYFARVPEWAPVMPERSIFTVPDVRIYLGLSVS